MDEENRTNHEEHKSHSGDKSQKITMAIIAYIIFFVPLLTEYKNDPFVKFHVKQGLVLLIAWVVGSFVSMFPILGWILFPFIMLALFILMVVGIINASNGKEKELPIIGHFAKSFTF